MASMMVGACRMRLASDPVDIGNGTYPLGHHIDPLVLTSALTLLVGCIQVKMAGSCDDDYRLVNPGSNEAWISDDLPLRSISFRIYYRLGCPCVYVSVEQSIRCQITTARRNWNAHKGITRGRRKQFPI